MSYLLNKGFRVIEHMKTRPFDKTQIVKYNSLDEDNIEQGSRTPSDKIWAIQVGAYRNKNVAKNATKEVLSLLPDTNDITVEILEIQRNKKSLFRARVEGFDKEYAGRVCSVVQTETNIPCILVKP